MESESELSIGSVSRDNTGLPNSLITSQPNKDNISGSNINNDSYGSVQPATPKSLFPDSSTSNLSEISNLRAENRSLKNKIRQQQIDLQNEQELSTSLRKKITNKEKDRLDMFSKSNEEISRLDGEAAKLRAQVEKGEAVRQNLEFELAKLRKDLMQIKRESSDREIQLVDDNDSMKQKIIDLNQQVSQLCNDLEASKAEAFEENGKLHSEISDKDERISALNASYELMETERLKTEKNLHQKERIIEELHEKIKSMEADRLVRLEELRRHTVELDLKKDKEQSLRDDIEAANERIRGLESSIEAERASHLESKFNSEIVQLRIHDLQSALQMEKNSKADMESVKERLNEQIKDLQTQYEEERRASQQSRENLEKDLIIKCVLPATRAEKEYAILSKQLATELDEKKVVIKRLSSQIELHQKNFNELKEQLNKAKKRQIYLEENYGGCMKELEVLIQNFDGKPTNGKKKATAKADIPVPSKSMQPTAVCEAIRKTLLAFQKQLNESSSELSKLKTAYDKLCKEHATGKQDLSQKEKSLKTSQGAVNRSNKELEKLKTDNSELGQKLAAVRKELNTSKKTLDSEKKSHSQLQETHMKMVTKTKAEEQGRMTFLHGLYQQLLTGCAPIKPHNGNAFTWTELANLLSEQAALLVSSIHKSEEKAKHAEMMITSRDEMLQQFRKSYEEQVSKLALLTEDRSSQWQQQKSDIENHYSQLLEEIHLRHAKSQELADEAWEKVRITGSKQHSLESECQKLRQDMRKIQTERNSLLAACALLSGALYPLYARVNALIYQRKILVEQSNRFETFKEQVQVLVDALSLDSKISDGPLKDTIKHYARKPLFRFRSAVIAVIAANRLCSIRIHTCTMFTAIDLMPSIHSTLICTGGVNIHDSKFKESSHDKSLSYIGERYALEWITSADLLHCVVSSMTDLYAAVTKAQDEEEGIDTTRMLIYAARSSFTKLFAQLKPNFQSIQFEDSSASERDVSSLARRLGHGLHNLLSIATLKGSVRGTGGSQAIISGLQQEVLSFTQRLHEAEVERRDLRHQVGRHKSDKLDLNSDSLVDLKNELQKLRAQVNASVSKERFDSVCKELDNTLLREREAQKILNKQSIHLASLKDQVGIQNQSEETLADAAKGLNMAKQEIKYQEQLVHQLNRQIAQVQGEKKSLKKNIKDAEQALQTASRDRESLTTYINVIDKAMEQIKGSMLKVSESESLLDLTSLLYVEAPTLSNKRPGPQVAACQMLVSSFVEMNQFTGSRIQALKTDIKAYKEHCETLKRELKAACNRESRNEFDLKKLNQQNDGDATFDILYVSELEKSEGEDSFRPLVELRDTPSETPLTTKLKQPSRKKKMEPKSIHKTPTSSKISSEKIGKLIAAKQVKK